MQLRIRANAIFRGLYPPGGFLGVTSRIHAKPGRKPGKRTGDAREGDSIAKYLVPLPVLKIPGSVASNLGPRGYEPASNRIGHWWVTTRLCLVVFEISANECHGIFVVYLFMLSPNVWL